MPLKVLIKLRVKAGFLSYLRENPGVPFISVFLAGLGVAASYYSENPSFASAVISYASIPLFLGILLQFLAPHINRAR